MDALQGPTTLRFLFLSKERWELRRVGTEEESSVVLSAVLLDQEGCPCWHLLSISLSSSSPAGPGWRYMLVFRWHLVHQHLKDLPRHHSDLCHWNGCWVWDRLESPKTQWRPKDREQTPTTAHPVRKRTKVGLLTSSCGFPRGEKIKS